MATDVMMITLFYRGNESGFALASLVCVSLNLFFQTFAVYVLNMNLGWKVQLRELLLVWTLIKPGVDAYRVAIEAPMEAGRKIEKHEEMTLFRVVEMIFEAVPGAAIQSYAIFFSTKFRTSAAFLALLSSISAAAFLSALMSYDYDTSADGRKTRPQFYGYIPASKRLKVLCFSSLFFISAFNLAVRILACFLLSRDMTILVSVLASELALYFSYKLWRRDWTYWTPFNGVVGALVTLMCRLCIKLLADWCAIVQFRHPNEVGGAYFSFSFVLTIALGMVSVYVYDDEEGESGEGKNLDKDTIMIVMGSACLGLILSFGALAMTMKRKYVSTFLSLQTSNSYCQQCFTERSADEGRFAIFDFNEVKWKGDIGVDVSLWVNERLPVWLEAIQCCAGTFWLTHQKLSQIPEWVVEDQSLICTTWRAIDEAQMAEKAKTSMSTITVMDGRPTGPGNDTESEYSELD
ncbi:hypothetical protein TrVE_jg7501 [Triparma verrucosa]|uniref:XK-related protein n=1 Tax=Triparma verrucosa TaxID=1606542 RepID=A0A9W7KUN0_9STRA|nr:hypothetical protein TrVE_jg7501 [Triparma verrucosa]